MTQPASGMYTGVDPSEQFSWEQYRREQKEREEKAKEQADRDKERQEVIQVATAAAIQAFFWSSKNSCFEV